MLMVRNLLLYIAFIVFSSSAHLAYAGETKGSSYLVGAAQPEAYLKHLSGKRIGLVVNQASRTANGYTVDQLIAAGIDVRLLFALEHGIRGKEDAGAVVSDGVDPITGIAISSLYGKSKQPSSQDLQEIDMIVYDIQDVGVRFFTYISSLHYLMQTCASHNVPLVILDRPNPNGNLLDGPILDGRFRSFVGMHPIPVLYGMTPGELGLMINGEGWLDQEQKCELTVIPLANYSKDQPVDLFQRPSPNLPNSHSIHLYPTLALFEATDVSIGRGTEFPFQLVGGPDDRLGKFQFTPVATPGMASNPKHKDALLFGEDLRNQKVNAGIDIGYFLGWRDKYHAINRKFLVRPEWLDKLMGTDAFRIMIEETRTPEEIKKSWAPDLRAFGKQRAQYLLYPPLNPLGVAQQVGP